METLPIHLLSREQKYAYRRFCDGHNLFVTGPGGSGKTQLIHTLVQYCESLNKDVVVCALTGCAAVLLNMKAKTLHSWAGIKLARGSKDKIIQSVLRSSKSVNSWKKVKVLIVDEVSMMSLKILELLEETARRVRKNTLIFGGIQVVFTGDFYQLPPVGDPNEPSTCQFCFQSKKWKEIFPTEYNSILLKTIFRQKDPIYRAILNEIRVGELSEKNAMILHNRMGVERNETDIITRLFPIKSKVETINKYNFEKINEKEHKQDMIVKTNCKVYLDTGLPILGETLDQCMEMTSEDIEFEVKRMLSILPTDQTVLMKKGAVVLLTFNLCVEDGLCNGSQGTIVDILQGQKVNEKPGVFTELIDIPVVKFTNGIVTRIAPHFWQSEDYPRIIIGQFPLILAWALTIHKIQGASIDRGEVDAGGSIFEYGQTYVGLSRIRSLEGLYLTNFHPKRIKAHPIVKEFYKSIRQDIIPDSDINEAEERSEIPTATAVKIENIQVAVPLSTPHDYYSLLPPSSANFNNVNDQDIEGQNFSVNCWISSNVVVNKLP